MTENFSPQHSEKSVSVVLPIGDPNGIGPEVVLKALARLDTGQIPVTVVGDEAYLASLSRDLQIPFPPPHVQFSSPGPFPYPPRWGVLEKDAGEYALKCLSLGIELCKSRGHELLVTGPINKKAAQLAGSDQPGQTEFVASFFPGSLPAMAFFSDHFHLLLATVHVALREVPSLLSEELLILKAELFNRALTTAGLKSPRIAVCGLNPHASENGLFGSEEEHIIIPALSKLVSRFGPGSFSGPWPADTVFREAMTGRYDAVIALYHDQGLAPLKLVAFDSAVNVTLGLPIIRSSPGHGTAFDIAGQGIADETSMVAAVRWGCRLLGFESEHLLL